MGVYYQAVFGITSDGRVVVCENRDDRFNCKKVLVVPYYFRHIVPEFLSADNFMETMEKVRESNRYDPNNYASFYSKSGCEVFLS